MTTLQPPIQFPDPHRKDNPTITVSLRVSRSVLTGFTDGENVEGSAIWGDGVDFAFVGIDYTVSHGWQIVPGTFHYDFEVFGGSKTPVDQFALFRQGPCVAYLAPTPERQIVVQVAWQNALLNGELTIRVINARVQLQNRANPADIRRIDSIPVQEKRLKIVAANIQILDHADTNDLSRIVADADGTSVIELDPVVWLFGEPYPGGYAIAPDDRVFVGGSHRDASVYFVSSTQTYAQGVDPKTQQGKLQLVCRFHVDDEAMAQISSSAIQVWFHITLSGLGPARGEASDCFDLVAAEHFKACQRNLKPDDLHGWVHVELRPSRVNIWSDYKKLPSNPVNEEAIFVSRLFAKVESHSGNPVRGEVVFAQNWTLDFVYKPPQEGRPPFSVKILFVDSQSGFCRFFDRDGNNVEHYDYDHQEMCWDESIYELRAQNCEVRAVVNVNGRPQDETIIEVGRQPMAVMVCFDYPAFVILNGNKDQPMGNSSVLEGWLKNQCQPALEIDDTALKKMAPTGIPENTVLLLGVDHCGIVRQGGEVWHFLQSNLFRQQGKWFNRNQIRKKEAYARRGS
ncbi:MAG: hypothetical protein ABIV92_15575, partial [Thermoflexales bacterium]